MSTWIKIEPDDIVVNIEDEEVEILYNSDNNGNNYITIPLAVLADKIEESTTAMVNQVLGEILKDERTR